MRYFKKVCLGFIAFLLMGSLGFALWLNDKYVVPIVMYHHVGPPKINKWRLNVVSIKSFEYQLNFMKTHGFQVISFDDLIEGIKSGKHFSHKTVVIQFDDGYEDNYTNALPVLKKYNFPAMVFLVSDKIGSQGFLTWDQVKEMEKHSFMAGAHTRHHIYLPLVSLAQAQDEVVGSKKIIEDHLGHSIDYFAYPSGGFTPQVKILAKEAGYKAAVSVNRGTDRYNADLYELKRIHMSNTDSQYFGLALWFKLSGYYNLFRQFRSNEVGPKSDLVGYQIDSKI